jgi:hypothetical protein
MRPLWIAVNSVVFPSPGLLSGGKQRSNGESTIECVKKSLLAAYGLAAREGYESLGVGAMGSGPAAIQPARWYKGFAQVSVGYLNEDRLWTSGRKPLSVVLVLFEPLDWEADVRALRRAISDAWNNLNRPVSGEPLVDFDGFIRHPLRAVRKRVARLSAPSRSALRRFRDRRSVSPEEEMFNATTPVDTDVDDPQLPARMSAENAGS